LKNNEKKNSRNEDERELPIIFQQNTNQRVETNFFENKYWLFGFCVVFVQHLKKIWQL
jgi:hypothetical protein